MSKQANFFQQTEEMFAPAKALSELALINTERLMDLQVEALRKYSNVVLASWKEALEVKDLEGAQKYVSKQSEHGKEVMDNFAKDAKTAAELGRGYVGDVQKVVADSLSKSTKKAA